MAIKHKLNLLIKNIELYYTHIFKSVLSPAYREKYLFFRVCLFNFVKLQFIKSITIKGKVTTKIAIIIEKEEENA